MAMLAAAVGKDRDHKRLGVAERVRALKETGWSPRLVSIAVGETEAAKLYIRNQRRAAEQVGITFGERVYPETVSRAEMLAAIATLNADHNVTGVIIQRPVPPSIAIKELQAAVHPLKDVGIIPLRSATSSTTTWCSGPAPRSPRSSF